MFHPATPSSSMMCRARLPAAGMNEARLRPGKDASHSPLFFDSRQGKNREILDLASTNLQWRSSQHKHTSVLLGENGQSRSRLRLRLRLYLNQLSTCLIRPHPLIAQRQNRLPLQWHHRYLLPRLLVLLLCPHGPRHLRDRYLLFPKKLLPPPTDTAPKQQKRTREATTQQPTRASRQPSQCYLTNTQSPSSSAATAQ